MSNGKEHKPHKAVYALPVLGLIVGIGFVNYTMTEMQVQLAQASGVRADERMSAMDAVRQVAAREEAERLAAAAAAKVANGTDEIVVAERN